MLDNAYAVRRYVDSFRAVKGIPSDAVDGIIAKIDAVELAASRAESPYAGRVAGWRFLSE